MASRIYPVILCGGSGKRLWPLSRARTPKQFLPLTSDRTLFQDTLLRLRLDRPANMTRFAPPIVIANQDHEGVVDEQLAAVHFTPAAIVLEPIGRNTAAAAAVAAHLASRTEPDSLVLLLPADHFIADIDGFHACLAIAEAAARAGHLTTFGISPTSPETGYGYIEQGAALAGIAGAYRVERFVEKPKLPDAERYIATGRFTWNSGMFLFRCDVFQSEMQRLCKPIAEGVSAALKGLPASGRIVLGHDRFSTIPSEPIDTAVMERTDLAAMVPAAIGWSDVGSFAALWQIGDRDGAGNVSQGDVILTGTKNTYIRAESRLVATLGVEDLVVIETGDAVLVASRAATQDIKSLVDGMEQAGRSEVRMRASAGTDLKWLEVAPDSPRELTLARGQKVHLIVTDGSIAVEAATRRKLLDSHETMTLSAGWSGRIVAIGSKPAHVLLVALADLEGTSGRGLE